MAKNSNQNEANVEFYKFSNDDECNFVQCLALKLTKHLKKIILLIDHQQIQLTTDNLLCQSNHFRHREQRL